MGAGYSWIAVPAFCGVFKHHLIDKDDTLERMAGVDEAWTEGRACACGHRLNEWIKPVLLFASDSDLDRKQAQYIARPKRSSKLQIRLVRSMAALSDGMLMKKKVSSNFVQYGTPFEGHFENFDSEIYFDPNDLDNSSVSIEIDIGSLKLAAMTVTRGNGGGLVRRKTVRRGDIHGRFL